jgi:hypothetical protein
VQTEFLQIAMRFAERISDPGSRPEDSKPYEIIIATHPFDIVVPTDPEG